MDDDTADDTADDARTEQRADLLPEERAAGSDDPELEARIILEDSDARTEDPEGTKHDTGQTPDDMGQLGRRT